MKFSERYGYTPVHSVLQTTGINEALRNRLWNVICSSFFVNLPTYRGANSDYLSRRPDVKPLLETIWHDYLKMTTDSIGSLYTDALGALRKYYFGCEWFRVYNFLEFLNDNAASDRRPRDDFINSINGVLTKELAGYRFVSNKIVEITSKEEITAIETALAVPDSLSPVREHLNQALTLLADKKNPDYRNSIKESISAIESMSKIISGLPKSTLSPALDAIEAKTTLHSALKEAFKKLYGYTLRANISETSLVPLINEQ
jgi:AbiJ N-terminal domain 4